MNRVYKVIWSKAKHCYVVTSEIAKSHTKGESTGRGLKKLAAALLVAAALMGPNFAWAADTVSVEPASATAVGSATAVEVYTKEGADKALHDETAARIGADAKLVEAVNSGITLNNENVLQKNTTTIVNDDGKVTTERGDVTEMILNKGKDNQITLSEDGIKVGKNSTVIASEGVFAGGDTADAAKAALNANGSIKGANGKFTVDTNGLVTANGGVDTNSGDILTRGGKINAGSGDISGKDISASGDISGKDITGSGTVKGHAVTDGTARMEGGALTGVTTITAGGDVVSTGGKVQGTSVSDGTATLSGGSLNNAVDINASGTITGNNVVVKGKLTTNGLETDRITLGSETLNQTDINKGNVTSKVNDTVGAVEYTAESIFNKDGSSITARTDEGIVDSTGKSIVGAKEISQYLGNNAEPKSSDKNVTRNMVRNGDGTFSMEDKAVDEGKSSTVSQNAGERKVTVAEGTNTLTVTENLTGGIVSETDDGAGQKVTLTQGMDGTYKVETSGTSTEEIGGQKVENYKGGLDTNITGDETHDVSGAMTTTVEGQATENFKNGLDTNITGDETHDVSGAMTTTVEGQATENFKNGLDTNITGDETHDVSGAMTTTVEGQATENFKNGLDTNITGDETHDVSGTMTTTVEGQVTENFNGGLDTNITGDETHDVSGTMTTTAKTVKTITGNNTVTSDTEGTTFKNTGANAAMEEGDEQGRRINTRIFGNQVETGKVLTDFADVNNNLTVGGNTTLGRDGKTTLTVNSKSTFKDTVKMEKTLEVDGTSTFNDKVTITKNGLAVTGGTTTDTLEVKGTSEFGGKAAFKDDVSMDKKLTVKGAAEFKDDVSMGKNLTVTGKTETGTLHVNGDGYVGGDLNVEGNIETHDAELSENSRQVVTGRQLYQTNVRVDKLDNRIKKVGANAAALAALRPGDFNPDDKFSIAAGFGSYRNASAAALGLFYRPNENVLLSLGTSFGDGENMVNAGVSVKFGRGKSMAERRKEMADEVSSMRDEMRSQDERIAELEEMLRKQSELIEKLSKES